MSLIKLAITIEDVAKRQKDRLNKFQIEHILSKNIPNVSYEHYNNIINRNTRGIRYFKKIVEKMAKLGK